MQQPRQRKKNARNSRRIYIGNLEFEIIFFVQLLPFAPRNAITIRAFEKLTLDNQKFTVKNEMK